MDLFNDDQKRHINWFFAMIQAAYGGGAFQAAYKSAQGLQDAKRFWARDILKRSPEELTEAFSKLKNLKTSGAKGFDFIDVGKVLSLCGQSWEHAAQSKVYSAPALEDKSKEEDRVRYGRDVGIPMLRKAFETGEAPVKGVDY